MSAARGYQKTNNAVHLIKLALFGRLPGIIWLDIAHVITSARQNATGVTS